MDESIKLCIVAIMGILVLLDSSQTVKNGSLAMVGEMMCTFLYIVGVLLAFVM